MEKVTICKECEFAEKLLPLGVATGMPRLSGICLSPDVPFSDFVFGIKACKRYNGGDCKFFKPLTDNGYAGNSNIGE